MQQLFVVLLLCLLAPAAKASLVQNDADADDVRYTLDVTHKPEVLDGLCDSVNQTAGYLRIEGSRNKNYFFWHFESRGDASVDPVILWMTGGPGCSSAVAQFHENGPCKINEDHKTTTNNPYSWNSNASLIFIDQPAGTGFSYGDSGDEDVNEQQAAEDMFHFLHEFFDKHPKLQSNPFYIFGESYGGHFVPSVAYRVGQSLNLKGIGVGNGLTNPLVQYKYYGQMAYHWSIKKQGHPTVSKDTYSAMQDAIPKCLEKIKVCNENNEQCDDAQMFCNFYELTPYYQTGLNPYDIREQCKIKPLCYDFSDVKDWLGQPHVQDALGVDKEWQSCNTTVNRMFSKDWMHQFQWTVPPLLHNDTRVLIYAGDVDFVCNWIGNKAWTKDLSWAGKQQFNQAEDKDWEVDGKVSGKLRTYNGLSFLQVFDAGHMVPLDKPKESLQMLTEFLAGKY